MRDEKLILIRWWGKGQWDVVKEDMAMVKKINWIGKYVCENHNIKDMNSFFFFKVECVGACGSMQVFKNKITSLWTRFAPELVSSTSHQNGYQLLMQP